MTLHAGLVNPTCLQSFRVQYCLVCELRCFKEEEDDEEFWDLWESRQFLFNPFPMHVYLHDFWSVV